ncbi:hypothetical protein Tco_1212554 [Tanacetum coccineum]
MTEAKDSEVCKITRADGSSSFHGDIQALLRRLDRQDLSKLYNLVQEGFKDHPLEGHDLDLWGDLRMIFDPNEEDDIWLNQQYWELLRWKLHEYSGVHSLFLDGTSIQINMLVEKKYPLKKEILEKMINLKIEAEEERKEAKVFERILSKSKSFNSRNLRFEGHSSTNDVNTANVHVSTGSTPVSTASTNNSTACLSDATANAYLATQPNGSQVVHEDLEQIHEDDLDEIDLKWQLALLSMKARKFYQRTGKRLIINEVILLIDRKRYGTDCLELHGRGGGFYPTLHLWAFSASEGLSLVEEQLVFYKKNESMLCDQIAVLKRDASFNESDINALKKQVNKGASENVSKEVKKTSDALIIEDWVSDCDEDETVVLESLNVQKPKQADQPRKVSQNHRNNSTSWNTPMPKKLGVAFQFTPKACFVCGSFNHLFNDY